MELSEDLETRMLSLYKRTYDDFTKKFIENIANQEWISGKQLLLFEKLEDNWEDINMSKFSIDWD